MSKRLQVIVADLDYREIQRSAQSRGMSIAEWVRQALDLARRANLEALRARRLTLFVPQFDTPIRLGTLTPC